MEFVSGLAMKDQWIITCWCLALHSLITPSRSSPVSLIPLNSRDTTCGSSGMDESQAV
jgi:hypothetical protein